MVRSPDTLERELLRLPKSDRARLAQVLLVSLDAEAATQSPAAVEAAWEAEIARRVAELRNGTVAGIPADEVFAEVLDRSARACRGLSASIPPHAQSASLVDDDRILILAVAHRRREPGYWHERVAPPTGPV